MSQTARNAGENEKTPSGTLSAFSVNWTGSESSLTEFSSPGRTRTYDKAINSRLLYQLSYRGMVTQQFLPQRYRMWNPLRSIYPRKVATAATGCKSLLGVFSFVIVSGI